MKPYFCYHLNESYREVGKSEEQLPEDIDSHLLANCWRLLAICQPSVSICWRLLVMCQYYVG